MGLSRRQLLMASAGLAMGGMLAGCTSKNPAEGAGNAVPLPRQDSPVKWPLYSDNKPIASGLAPEKGATLQIYNWVAYINESVIKNFCKQHNCSYALTTFNTMEEALSKLSSGELKFDVFFPTVDVLGQMIGQKMIRPLNHSYIPNITNAWTDYRNPFYDQDWQYTTPYSIYTTGMGWRRDKVNLAPSWNMPWQGARYKGKVAVLDDYRETISLALMHGGNFDLNTTSTPQIHAAGKALANLANLTGVRIDNNDYTDLPTGKTWIHHGWSGDMAASFEYLPKGQSVDTLGYWFPANQKGPVANDLMVNLTGGQNPVLSPQVHGLHARRRQRARELQLRGLHAAAQRGHSHQAGVREAAAQAVGIDGRAAGLLPPRHLPTRTARGRQLGLGRHVEHVLQRTVR